RVRDQSLLVARRTLAVVLELRLDALHELEVLVSFGRHGRELLVGSRSLDGLRLFDMRPSVLLGHDFAASSSSMTSKSASSTTSSSVVEPPFPEAWAAPDCAAAACA